MLKRVLASLLGIALLAAPAAWAQATPITTFWQEQPNEGQPASERTEVRVVFTADTLYIGAVLYDSVGHWLIQLYGYNDKVEAFRHAYAQWGAWIILLKGLTPIPYKIVTITSGFAGYNFLMFVLLSFVARGMRFYLLAFLLNRYGAQARVMLEERLGFWVSIGAAVLVIGIVAAVYLV